MATMKDVAREAKVSLGTVSNVLNKRPTVTEANCIKVMNAVRKLKYRPNTAARTLKTNTSKSIGLVIPDIKNPFYPELARGVEDTAKKSGYSVLLCNNDRSVDKEREYINILIEKNIDGIILIKPKVSLDEIAEIQKECSIVLVDVDYDITSRFDSINVDDYNGMLDAMNLLYEYGHRNIAFISGMLESKSSKIRHDTYIEFLRKKNIPVNEELIKMGSYDWYSGYKCTVELLRNITPPTAILAANDLMAIGTMKAIHERRLRIPFDISVMGYDDIDMAVLCTPQLTTVRQPKYELGITSVEILLERMKSGIPVDEPVEGAGRIVTMKTEIMLRETLGYVKT